MLYVSFLDVCVIGNVNLNGRLRFEEFDISTVLEKGDKLLGSTGDEYDFEEDPVLAGKSYFKFDFLLLYYHHLQFGNSFKN